MNRVPNPKLLSLILIVAHLPLLLTYYSRLWQQEHYQFFPFALMLFGWFLYGRKEAKFQFSGLTVTCLSVDLLLLAAGWFLYSPWLVAAGAVAACFGLAAACRDREIQSSLAYLGLLPLLTLRLPLMMDVQVIQWLQKVTTVVASLLMNHFGYLHLREGNVIAFPEKTFLVAEACSGVQSLFTLLFLASVIVCGYRRKWLHSLAVLTTAAGMAGVMNVIRVITISVAWDRWEVDLATGFAHDMIGYTALILAAILVYSADVFLAAVLAPIPDIAARGISVAYLNPLISVWNKCFLVHSNSTSQDKSELSRSHAIQAAAGERTLPPLKEYFRPTNSFAWLIGVVDRWIRTRNYSALKMSLPILVVSLAGSGFVWWLQTAPRTTIVKRYERAADQAIREGDDGRQRIYLEALLQLRPLDSRYRLVHVRHLIDNDELARAIPHVRMLTSETKVESPEAHFWLAQQALAADPALPLEPQQIERHLLRAVELNPREPTFRLLLADVLSRRGQLLAAEEHLTEIVSFEPRAALQLARLKVQLNREPKSINSCLEIAAQHFLEKVRSNPADVESRIRRSEALMLLGQQSESERNLLEGLPVGKSPLLTRALSRFYSDLARRRMDKSPLNSELASDLINRALKLSSENSSAIKVAMDHEPQGVKISSDVLKPALDHLAATGDLTGDDGVLLVRGMVHCGLYRKAMDVLTERTSQDGKTCLMKLRIARMAGFADEEVEIVAEILGGSAVDDEDGPSLVQVMNAAEALSIVGRPKESVQRLEPFLKQMDTFEPNQQRRFSLLWIGAGHSLFDMQAGQSLDQAMDALDRVLEVDLLTMGSVERLSAMSAEQGDPADRADKQLNRILARGVGNAQIFKLIGDQAMKFRQFRKARRLLERAHSLAPKDPAVLNNLALALVRGDEYERDPERAFRLVELALEILPNHPDVFSTRAEVLIATNQWEKARSDLEVALNSRPSSINCRLLLAVVCDAQGETELAKEYRRSAQELQNKENDERRAGRTTSSLNR